MEEKRDEFSKTYKRTDGSYTSVVSQTPLHRLKDGQWENIDNTLISDGDILKNADGSFVGIWGAMSDETLSFLPWTDDLSRGLFLADVDVNEDTEVPDGWVKWVMPARKYLVTDVQPETYGKIFEYVIKSLIPDLGMKLVGAVCDFTEPATGQSKLFFPVK